MLLANNDLWGFITADFRMTLAGLLFMYLVTSAQVLAVDALCTDQNTQIV